MKLSFFRHFVLACTLVVLVACTKVNPMLEKHPEYIGQWQSDQDHLVIEKNGQVSYTRLSHTHEATSAGQVNVNEETDLKTAISSFDEHYFQIGQGRLGKRFEINQAPYQEQGQWRMQLDHKLYIKQ